MSLSPFHMRKRFPTALAILLSGVAFAGFLSRVIEAPIGSSDYLHEHLTVPANMVDADWGDANLNEVSFNLQPEDRKALVSIIRRTERPNWTPGPTTPVTGQALYAAKDMSCAEKMTPCVLTVRLGREFNDTHTNRDFRVTNVKETSLRVTFNLDHEASEITIGGIENETRLFRFYQTQTGWVQNTSEVLEVEPLFLENRDGAFKSKFSKGFVGVNYYPASASWKDFWTTFPVAEIKSDLHAIKTMKANSVRVFLNHAYFDDQTTQEQAKSKFRAFLDLCEAEDIKILVTLFDLRPDYTLSNLQQDVDHIDQVLSDVSDHPAILGVDIKNQADLDFEGWGQGLVEGWLTVMARHIQLTYPELAVTVGWSQPKSAMGLKDVVDFVTYHEYGNPAGFADRLEAIKAGVHEKPVMITELGSTIWSPFRTTRSAETKQASRLEHQLDQALEADGIFVWTLNDFEHVGSDVVGRRPWRKAQQRHFGLIREDGTARPSKNILEEHAVKRAAYTTQNISQSRRHP